MRYERSIETPTARELFETGYEHIWDSMRTDTTDSAREKAEAAHRGALFLAAAQAAALIDLVEAQHTAITMTAMLQLGEMAGHGSDERTVAELWLRSHLRQ